MGIFSSLCRGVGNTLIRIIYSDTSTPDHHGHAITQPTNSVSAMALDLFHFENTCQVPEKLSEHVTSSKKAQARWYKKLLKAWKDAKPPTKTPDQASRLLMQALHQHKKADVEGLLNFYGLPVLHEHQIGIPAVVVFPPEAVKFKLQTVPVDAKAVDGDGLTVYVDAADHREALSVPSHVLEAVLERPKARTSKDYPKADALHKTIIDAGYRMLKGSNNVDILARKYRIRLRYATKNALRIAFPLDSLHSKNPLPISHPFIVSLVSFLQAIMLKKGLAWHYAAYDKRPELIELKSNFPFWAKKARAAGVGLWEFSDPKEPWEWRKNNSRNGKLDKLN
ncbi:hypothetical protein MKX03_009945 [Papaver bracteatum]|nr:hypothetical protein MKX03_009945 [Papaver bracteatum]